MEDTALDHRRRVALTDLRPHPRNYQKHPPDQIEHIKKSLLDFGQYKNVVVARDLTILAGHGVTEAMVELGWDEAEVRVLDLDPDSPLALRLVAGDNEIGNLADVNDRALTELLREVAGDPLVGLLGSGFDEMQLAALAMITRPESEMRSLSAAAEWVGLPPIEEKPPEAQLTVKFLSKADLDRFLREVMPEGTQPFFRGGNPLMQTAYWPPRGMNDLRAIAFDDREAATGG